MWSTTSKGVGRWARQWQVATGLLYRQVKKIYRRRRLVRVTYAIRCGTRTTLKTALQTLGLIERITTAFVEQALLTVRQSVAALIAAPGRPCRRRAAAHAPGVVAGVRPTLFGRTRTSRSSIRFLSPPPNARLLRG
jgi:hypothetical protein